MTTQYTVYDGEEVDTKLAFLVVLGNNNNGCSPNNSVRKRTFTGLLTNYFTLTSFNYKVSLVKALVDRVYKINSLWGAHNDFRNLILILCKNLFPLSVINKIINFYLSKKQNHTERTDNAQKRQLVSLHYLRRLT